MTWHQGKHPTGAISLSLQPEGLVLEYCYRANGADWEPVREVITLYWTPCHYGGSRPWFLCPGCQRRVAILCCRGKWFLCRHCYWLPYTSQYETRLDRLYRKLGFQALSCSCRAWHDANHLKYRIIPSKVGERIWGNDFMRRSLA